MRVLSLGLRETQPSDAPFLFDLYTTTRDVVAAAGWNEADRLAFLRREYRAREAHFRRRFPDAETHVICIGATRAGRLIVNRTPEEIYVVDMAVLPVFRKEGIATRLLELLVDEARADAIPVRLWMDHSNPALRLYTQLGFSVIAELGDHALLESTADVETPSTRAAAPKGSGEEDPPVLRRSPALPQSPAGGG